jgi:myo-inositol-1(or 4)-monophosphatase
LPKLDAADLARRRRVAEEAARAAGAIQMKYYASGIASEEKEGDPRDRLTRADTEGQGAAVAVLRAAFPGDLILGEEDDTPMDQVAAGLADCWVIDPLDATLNYTHDFPSFAAGIAYVHQRLPLAAAIYVSVHDEMFAAARGQGASLNGKPIRVVAGRSLKEAFVGIHAREAGPEAARIFLETTGRILPIAHGVRLLGCPMISMAYVACGRLDCFATLSPTKLAPWDVAPAALVVWEAGGVVATSQGAPFDILHRGIAGASSQALLDELMAVAHG